MKQFLSRFFLKDISKWQFWLLLAFIFKGIIFIFLLYRHDINPIPGFRGVIAGDTYSYFSPIDNFIAHGAYSPDFRMPGYGFLYYPFALLFSKTIAYNIIIILQFIAASLSVYCLALITHIIFKSKAMFYLTFYLFAISTYTSLFDSTLLTESFTTSFLIFAVFFLLKVLQNESKTTLNLVLSGLFLTEAIFMRPAFSPLLLPFSVVILVFFHRNQSRKFILRLLVFMSPFLLFEGAWLTRNFIKHNKFIPVTSSLYYPNIENTYYLPIYTLARSWGGSDQIWEPDAEIRWFGIDDGLAPELHNVNVSLPTYIYTSKFNYDSLVVLKKQLTLYLSNESNPAADSLKMKSLLITIRKKCYLYANSIKEEKPFLYYVVAPIMRTKHFLVHSGTYNLFNTLTGQLGRIPYCIKLFYSLLYLLVIGFGAIGIILLLWQSMRFTPVMLIWSIVVFTIVIHPIILGAGEKRYFVPAYPFMLIFAIYTITILGKGLLKNRSSKI
ncbi:MAG TPA: hypothetical protein VNY36_06775 [Bacteroidia bacterium]|nr:hypothetical protein [Bacteroidia bacterium]